MPRTVIKKSDSPLHHDPLVWGIAGAYVVGILMAGMISVMTSLPGFSAKDLNVTYNQSKAAFDEAGGEVSSVAAKQQAVVTDNNILINGSFELPIIRSQSRLVVDGTNQLGWTVRWANDQPRQMSLTRQPGVELLAGYQGWQAAEGAQFARLDTADLGARSARTQSLVALVQKVSPRAGTYELSFDFAAQPKTGTKENQLEIKWDGVTVASLTADGSQSSKPEWKHYTYTVRSTGAGDRLEIIGQGEENNKGILVDNFSLIPLGK